MIITNRYFELIDIIDEINKVNIDFLGPYFNVYGGSINKYSNYLYINKKDIKKIDILLNDKISNNDIYFKMYLKYYGYLELLKNISFLEYKILDKYKYLKKKDKILSKNLYKFLNLKFCPYKLMKIILKEYGIKYILYKIDNLYILYLPYKYDGKLEMKINNVFYYFKPIEMDIKIIWEYISAYINIKNLCEMDEVVIRE